MSFPRAAGGFFSSSVPASSSTSQAGALGMELESKEVIDKVWIESLTTKIDASYPKKRYSWQDHPEYPKEDVSRAYVKNHEKNAIYQRYNPFCLRLPFYLEGYESFYDHTRLTSDDLYGVNLYNIHQEKAASCYFDFLKEYNLAYITFLQAINGSDKALTRLKSLFTTEQLFLDAGTKSRQLLKNEVRDPQFVLALLAYLVLEIVFSKEQAISTTARINALEIVRTHFDIDKVSAAFQTFHSGYGYAPCRGEENFFDLIPKRFVTRPEEAGGMTQQKLFWDNAKIKQIFPLPSTYPHRVNLDGGVSILLNQHPSEMLQVLYGLLKVSNNIVSINIVFAVIVNLSRLDGVQKGQIFGEHASYRNNGESKSTLDTRIGWVLGSESFGDYINEDELNILSAEELKQRVRQSAYRIHQLECELLEAKKDSVFAAVTPSNDPKGYFATLLIHPDTEEAEFDTILKRNFRTLAMKYHPDRLGGDKVKFQQVNAAYEFLGDAEKRKSYGKSERHRNVFHSN